MSDPREDEATSDESPVTDNVQPVAAPAREETAEARPARRKPVSAPKTLAPYAIIETGGKQYRVSVGDSVSVEKLDTEAGTDVIFDRVLLVGGDGSTRVGTPTVDGASVVATVQEQYRGEKIVIFKYKPKKRYRRKTGHRQSLTRLAITAINA
jgi:large subunit ribosomal protein L21